jgi:hypothetical protein
MAIEILPDMDYYAGREPKEIEADLKAKVKMVNETLPSYKTITKTIVVNEPINHEVTDRFYNIEW